MEGRAAAFLDGVLRRQIASPAGRMLLLAGRVQCHVPGFGIIEARRARSDVFRNTHVEDLADARGEVAVHSEKLRQRDAIGQVCAEVGPIGEDASRSRSQAGQPRRATGIAVGILAIRPVKAYAALRQPIDIWSLDYVASVTAEMRVEVICDDK